MALYKASSPNVELIGYQLESIVRAMGNLKILSEEMLERHGLKDFSPDRWYAMQNVIDVVREIDEQMGPHTLPSRSKVNGRNNCLSTGVYINTNYNKGP